MKTYDFKRIQINHRPKDRNTMKLSKWWVRFTARTLQNGTQTAVTEALMVMKPVYR
jgi:hypothetical protein